MRPRTGMLLLFPLLAACAAPLPEDLERGDCTLDRVTERVIHSRPLAPDEMIELESPYVVTLKRNHLDGAPEAHLSLEGEGWQPTDPAGGGKPTVRIVKPDGTWTATLSHLREAVVRVEHTVNAPGVWTYIVGWERIDCRQIVSIEVRALP
jgi:hypothetical protein